MEQDNNAPEPRQASNNKKIMFVLCIYLFLIMTTRYIPMDLDIQTSQVQGILNQQEGQLTLQNALNVFTFQQIYQGSWKKQGSSQYPFDAQSGKMIMYLDRSVFSYSSYAYRAEFQILNGQYIDKGTLFYDFYLNYTSFFFDKLQNGNGVVYLNCTDGNNLKARFRHDEILSNINQGIVEVPTFNFTFTKSLSSEYNLDLSITVQFQDAILTFSSLIPQNKSSSTMIFAAVILFCSFMPFSAMMKIIKDIMELRDNPRRYSFVTILITNMWDTVLCIISFLFAFRDQESLMLFIVPAFILCLLFTNLEPRLLIYIFQDMSNNELNLRQQLCRFNLLHYGSILAIYPLLIFTNFNYILFIFMSCLFIPQIYTNALSSTRPNPLSHYYIKYLLSRFLLVIYLRCNPYNIFSLQPNYILTFICCLIILIQLGLVYIQSLYGAKTVIPRFLLEPVFDYKLEEEFNIEEGIQSPQCSICLTPLHIDPPSQQQLQFEPKFKLMKTPCNHHYHSHCLMVWMKIKMECPQCRHKLPPYE